MGSSIRMRLPAVTRFPAISNGARAALGLRFFLMSALYPGDAGAALFAVAFLAALFFGTEVFFDGVAAVAAATGSSKDAVVVADCFLVIGAERDEIEARRASATDRRVGGEYGRGGHGGQGLENASRRVGRNTTIDHRR
jgi:hypothetical protein